MIGISSVVFTLISLPLNVISGIGVSIALVGLALACIAVLLGGERYAAVSFCIATISIFVISPLPLMMKNTSLHMVSIISGTYSLLGAAFIFRFFCFTKKT